MAFAQGHKKVGLLLTRMKPGKVKYWREQLLHETKQLPRIKLKIFGSTMVGKTQLTNSLMSGFISAFLRKKLATVSELTGFNAEQGCPHRRRPILPHEWTLEAQHENYTRGINVHQTSAYSLWDFSGYEPYFFFYDHFIGDVNCIHLVVFSLLDTPDWRRASVRFWLDFLYARIPVFEPLHEHFQFGIPMIREVKKFIPLQMF
ncbi:hypothetical protein AHF37_07939 [Paragonimus kellicotti]|nr:hypothetical protein AHF37_07939 [Paragonimus kellicotti]